MAQFILRSPKSTSWHQRTPWQAPPCIHEARRTFAVSSNRTAARGAMARSMAAKSGTAPQTRQNKHPKTEMKKQVEDMTAETLPHDMGLFPQTLVFPSRSKLPSIFKDPRLRARIEYERIWQWGKDFGAAMAYKFFLYRGLKRSIKPKTRPRIGRKDVIPAAQNLHVEIYEAFVNCDMTPVEEKLCETLLTSFKTRIGRRNPNERMEWQVVRYNRKPKITSFKCGYLGVDISDLPVAMQQAVVKISSVQKVRTGKKGKNPNWSEWKEKSVTEYLIIQRRLIENELEDWRAWGYAKEMSPAEFKPKVKSASVEKATVA